MNTIIDSGNVMEAEGIDEPEAEFSDLTATEEADASTMDFHIQMRGYTMRDFETMVVHAAATQLVGGRNFQTEIRDKAAEIANEKLDKELREALKDVMSITAAKRGNESITLSDMIRMEAKDYLTEKVDSSGQKDTSGWGRNNMTRAQYLAGQYLHQHFKGVIESAMKDLRDEIKAEIGRKIDAAIAKERGSIAKALGYEIEKRR